MVLAQAGMPREPARLSSEPLPGKAGPVLLSAHAGPAFLSDPLLTGRRDALTSDLRVWTEDHDDAVVVHAVGEVDMRTTEELQTAVNQACVRPGGRILVIELSGVTFFGSTGLAILESALRDCRNRGTILRVAAASRAVVRPLQMMGMDGKIELVPTEEEALVAV